MTTKRRSFGTGGIAAFRRGGVLCLAICAFVAQLFVTSNHVYIDEEGWVGFPLTEIAPLDPASHHHAHHHGSTPEAMPADAPAGHKHFKRPDCQVCQSLPAVSASLAMAPVEAPPPPSETTVGPIASPDVVAIAPTFSRHQPRAPPALA